MDNQNVPSPKKWLGQNFLIDKNLSDRIVYSIGPLTGKTVLEIGPGHGMLTRSIINIGQPAKLICLEKDRDMAEHLTDISNNDNVGIEWGDALEFNEQGLFDQYGPINIVANLPYNVATLLIYKWLDKVNIFESINVMVQKEVAERVMAPQHSNDYGWLSVLSQLYCDIEEIIPVPPSSFFPMPKVDSSFISMRPLSKLRYEVSYPDLVWICKMIFQNKRKIIKNGPAELVEFYKLLQIDTSLRPQNISVEEFCQLSMLRKESKSKLAEKSNDHEQ